MIERVQANINLGALQANFQIAKSFSKKSKMAAVIKANAYGHGLIPVAQALTDADLFAVTDVNEAEKLSNAGISQPILILQGIIDATDVKIIVEKNYQVVLHSIEQVALLDQEIEKLTIKAPLTCWLKIETGMNRLGIRAEDYQNIFSSLETKPYINELIMMTHYANSSIPDSGLNRQQTDRFVEVKNSCLAKSQKTLQTSMASSAGIISNAQTIADWARPGIMLYGSSPFSYQQEQYRSIALGLKAVMSLSSKIIAIQHLQTGDSVGYHSQFICHRDMRIAIVSVGYADGYPSNTPNGAPVLINDKRCYSVGRVSMDMMAVDLSNSPEAKVGDHVLLWGENLALDEVAEKTGILSYNLTCSISSRVKFSYG